MKTIQIVISSQGNARVQTQGFAGPACQEASRFLEQSLGSRAGEQLTAEYYEPAQQTTRNQRAQTGGPGEGTA